MRANGQLLMRRVPVRARGAAARALSLVRRLRAGRRRPDEPLVSVVVAACDDESAFLDQALSTLRDQRDSMELLLVTHGRSGLVAAAAARHLAEDPRLRLVESVAETRAQAFNAGARVARGRYLSFVRAADVVPVAALHHLVRALETSRSDFALGRMVSADRGADVTKRRSRYLHGARRTTLVDLPAAITNTHPGNRMLRAAFWHTSGLEFPEDGRGHRDPIVEAYLMATAFDVVDEVTYRSMNRGNGTAIGQHEEMISRLPEWLESQRDTLGRVSEAAGPVVRQTWVAEVLENQLQKFLPDLECADERQWLALRDYVRELVEAGGNDIWSSLSAEASVRTWLTTHDRRDSLEQLSSERRFENGQRRTEVRDGRVYTVLPFYGCSDPAVPDECFVMSEDETPLVADLLSIVWKDDELLELALLVYIAFVGYDAPPQVAVSLVEENTGATLALQPTLFRHAGADMAAGHRYQDYSAGGCRVALDTAALVEEDRRLLGDGVQEPRWRLAVEVTARGLTRSGTLTSVDLRGTAGGLQTSMLAPRDVDGRLVVLDPDPVVGLLLTTAEPSTVMLSSAAVSGRRVRGELATDPTTGVDVRAIVVVRPGGKVEARAELVAGRFELDLPDVGYAAADMARYWVVRVVTSEGEQPVGWPADLGAERWLGASASSEVAWRRSLKGNCEILEVARSMMLDDVRLGEGELTVRGSWLGVEPARWRLALRSPRAEVAASRVESQPSGEFVATFPTEFDEWGLGAAPLPAGSYRLVLHSGGPEQEIESPPLTTESLTHSLLEEQLSTTHRMRLAKPGIELRLVFEAPLSDDERGPHAQHVLQQRFSVDADLTVDPNAVYLQAYHGGPATDSQLAIARELQASRPDLHLGWAVADPSSWVPDGVTRLLLRSAEWYRFRATAGYLVTNIDFDRRFEKRAGQRLLQSFHGYPSKSMGIAMWKDKQFTPAMIEAELERTSRDWDLILTPVPEMDRYYRSEYLYDGPIHSHGYPRDDALLADDAELVRDQTRSRLGILPHQTVVLYAPTWRDHLATSWRSAPVVRHLDLKSASKALGDDYVLLMRGHRFQRRARDRDERAARLLDVTTYPEVNDLILASDAAVLDYSSMRFDFALTNRPMIFLVPDLDVYTGGARGFLFDYFDTTPGPLLETADEVVEHLRNLDTVRDSYAEAYQRFNATYNYLQDGNSAARVVEAFFGPGQG